MRKKIRYLVLMSLVLASVLLLMPRPDLYEGYKSSQAIYDQQGKLLRLTLSDDDKYRLRVPLNKVSPVLIDATLLYEDRYFHRHFGINPVALFKAGWTTYVSGSRRVGASTITMQLARMRFDIDSHTLSGKFLQILRSLQLEWHYEKDEILEAYLNYAPYGGNIEGIASASLIYFNKTPDSLTLHEAVTLSVIPQSPSFRSLDRGAANPGLLAARDELISRWSKEHSLSLDMSALLKLPVQARGRKDLPFYAPHFVEQVLGKNSEAHIHTTLDLELQSLVERNTRRYLENQQRLGINNAIALLVDSRDMSVKALLGSADYHNNAIHGQVNGTLARRSPGSTLKPFIYALALEQGLIHPHTMLKDTQTNYGAYNPENFDHEFTGPVTATNALIYSRNVPAVQLASKLQQPDLYDFLKQARVDLPETKQHYGLSLVLGGAEIDMQSLVRLYAVLVNHGRLNSLRLATQDKQHFAPPLLSESASYLTYEMLTHNKRPQQSYQKQWLRDPVSVAWKTGTSYGHRDAWSIGIVGPYILAVWVGNFNGHANPELVGRTIAGPLFFNLVDAIVTHQPDIKTYQMAKPAEVKKIRVCSLSGSIPTKFCPVALRTDFIPGVSPIKKCSIHRQILIDNKTGLRACQESSHTHKAIYEFWPSDLLDIFRKAGIARRMPPPYLPACKQQKLYSAGVKPAISFPFDNVQYYMRTSQTQHRTEELPLSVITDADVKHVYWFMNEEFIGKANAQHPLYWKMQPGEYQLRVIDDHGRSDAQQLSVLLTR